MYSKLSLLNICHNKRNAKLRSLFSDMRFVVMFVTAVCALFLTKILSLQLNVINTWELPVFVAELLAKEVTILPRTLAKSVDKIKTSFCNEKLLVSRTEA